MRGLNKDFSPLIRAARKQGWTVAIGKRHVKWCDQGGHLMLVTSSSRGHGGGRQVQNARALLRRAGVSV